MNVEFTNMVMITDPQTGKVAVIDRVKSWCGYAFPGGHVKSREAFYDSAVREVYEETGLTVSMLENCGIIQWIHANTGSRYIVVCYRTDSFTGTLKEKCDEGRLCWMTLDELENTPSENDFKKYIDIFKGRYVEAVGIYNDVKNLEFKYIERNPNEKNTCYKRTQS